jgi:predicted lipoprotein
VKAYSGSTTHERAARTHRPPFWAEAIALCALVLTAGCDEPPRNEHVRPFAPGGSGRPRPDEPMDGSAAPRPGDGDGGVRDGGGTGGAAGLDEGPVIGGGGSGGRTGESGSGGGGQNDAEAAPDPDGFTKAVLLEAAGQCAIAHYRDFEPRAQALLEATQGYADNLDESHAEAAREAWRFAIASFERVELFRFGPMARSQTDPGGQNLRDEIYAFPLGNNCRVDQQIVARTYEGAGFASTLAGSRGLSALEYLLFYTGTSNACPPSDDINGGPWAALSASELAQRRADYAAAAAADVLARTSALIEAWDPDGGDFYAQLTEAGAGSTVYPIDQDALNAVSDGMFYVENEVKDLKLGWPLGRVPECANSPNPCPNSVESRYALASTDHLRQNLLAFRKLFQGCGPDFSGAGFDDWLHRVGAGDLSDRMLEALTGAENAVAVLDPPLEQALYSDLTEASGVHAAVKGMTDLLKTEFVTVLNLELPEGLEGDND